jgi:hypothetical protein
MYAHFCRLLCINCTVVLFFFLLRIDYNDYLLQDTFPIIYASYKIWPLASVVNFALIPVEKRIVFLSMVGLIWGIFLSLTAANQ